MAQRRPLAATSGIAERSHDLLDFYTQHSAMTSPGCHAHLFDPLPAQVAELARMVQGLVLYEHVAEDFYGVRLADERRNESHIRALEAMLDAALAMDNGPLQVARAPHRRLVGVCRHFMLITVAVLRAKGIPARARCGFGSYFNPGYFEDHWVCEFWNAAEQRWTIVDSQFDEVWSRNLKIDHNVLDVPRDRFLTASAAWIACRAGHLEASKFGIYFTGLRGLWFIAASLVRDVAALNRIEVLPWDIWGAQPPADAALTDEELGFFDELARLTQEPDATFDELRARYHSDDRLRVPATVFNALRQRPETVLAASLLSGRCGIAGASADGRSQP